MSRDRMVTRKFLHRQFAQLGLANAQSVVALGNCRERPRDSYALLKLPPFGEGIDIALRLGFVELVFHLDLTH